MNDGLIDVRDGLRRYQLWMLLAWRDVKRTNIRTRLGILWHTLTFFIVCAGIGFLYAEILGQTKKLYVPYVSAGFLAWNFVNAIFSEGGAVLVRDRGIITQVPTPFTLYVFRFVLTHAVALALNLIGYFMVLLSFGILPKPHVIGLVIAFVFYILTGSALTIIISITSVFQAWLPSLLPSVMRLAFFVTPVIWMPQMILGEMDASAGSSIVGQSLRAVAIYLNPLFHYLEVFRGNLIGYHVSIVSWIVVAAIAFLLWIAAVMVLSRTKTKVLVRL